MARLSREEEKFLIHGAEDNIRDDGRCQLQYRPIEIETGVIPSAMGSARVTLGNTDAIACVKANTFTPTWDKPNEGKLEIHVDMSATASPRFEGKRGELLSEEISAIINNIYECICLESFCIIPQEKCWYLHVDVSILSVSGNIYDIISFAVKCALATSSIPKMISSEEDKGEQALQISDDPSDTWTPEVSFIPCLITLSKVGDSVLVDLNNYEEQCSSFACVLAVTETGKVISTYKIGPGSVQPSTFGKLISAARYIGKSSHSELFTAMKNEQKNIDKEIHGFLS